MTANSTRHALEPKTNYQCWIYLKIFLPVVSFILFSLQAKAIDFPVTNTKDAGPGSLRQAIIDVNAAGAGPHNIVFNVYGQITILTSLPPITKSDVTVDGQNRITINSNGTNQVINPFDIRANNITIRNFSLTNSGDIYFIVRANTTGVLIENINTSSTTGNFLNSIIYVAGTSTNLTLRKITSTDVEPCGSAHVGRAIFFTGGLQNNVVMDSIDLRTLNNGRGCEGVVFRDASINGLTFTNSDISGFQNYLVLNNTGGPVETANNVLLNKVTMDSTHSGVAFGFYSDFVNTNIQIKNTVIDMNVVTSADDGDHPIRFDNTTNNITLDSVQIKDQDIYGIWFNGAAQNIMINHSSISDATPGAGNSGQFIRFQSTATTVTIKNTILNADKNSTTDDADYGIVFVGATNGTTLDSLTINEFDVDGIYVAGANTNFLLNHSTFTNNFDGIELYNIAARTNVDINNSLFKGHARSGIMLNAGNATSDIDLEGDTVINNLNNGIWLYGGTPATDVTITGCVVYGNGGAGIYNADPDKVNYTNNSIYNNTSPGIDNVSGNCGYQGASFTPALVSSTSIGGGQYQVQLTLPAVCATGCTVEFYANDPATFITSGQYYVTTFTGLLNGTSTQTFTYNTGPGATGLGFWTATLRVPSNNCGTSEFSNPIPISIKGPACVNNGIVAWYSAGQGMSNLKWADISGNSNHMTRIGDPDDTTGLVNFNKAVYYDGNDEHRAPATAAVTTAYTMMGLGKLEGTQNGRVFTSTTGNKLFGWHGGFQDRLYIEGWINPNTNPLTNYTRLYSLKRTNTGSGPFEFKGNGTLLNSGASSNGTTWTLDIAAVNGTEFSKVFVPEVFVYNRDLTAAEMQRIESYMALKYGITLNNGATNYVASDGTTAIWTVASNTGYGKRITGIGRDDCTLLNQKQSLSADTGLVTIAIGSSIAVSNAANSATITNDNSFFVFGDNNNAVSLTIPVAGSFATQRMARVWKVQKTNWADQNIAFKVNGAGVNNYLLISSDPAFGTISQELQLNAAGTVTLNSSLLASGNYFTVGAALKGPACVNTGIALWLRADDGTANGAQWNDASGNANGAAQTVVASQPTVLPAGVNFNPALKFDGTNDYLKSPSLFTAPGVHDVQVYGVSVTDNVQTNTLFSEFVSNSQYVLGYIPWSDGILYWDAPYSYRAQSAWGGRTSAPFLWSFLRSPSAMNAYRNRTAVGTFNAAMNTIAGNNSPFNIGSINAGTNPLNGKIAELIVYNNSASITAAQRQQIESYLALKYGLTLDQTTLTNYLASDGTTAYWNATANTGYNRHITGIGRDDCTILNQKQSRSADTGYVTLALGSSVAATNAANANTITTDNSYFVLGDNGAAMTFSNNVTGIAGVNVTLARIWKVQKTNWTDQNITLSIDSAQAIPQFIILSTDATFGAGDVALPLVNGMITLNSSQLASGSFFTFGNALKGPGGVITGISMWLRADDRTVTGARWNDYSGKGSVEVQNTAANQPTVLSSSINFNPVLKFDGVNDFMSAPSIFTSTGVNEVNIYGMIASDVQTSGVFFGELTSNGNYLQGLAPYTDGNLYWDAPYGYRVVVPWGGVLTRPYLWTFTRSAPGGLAAFRNKKVMGTFAGPLSNIAGNNSPFNLGSLNGGANSMNGRIGELIVYNSSASISATQRLQIESYLALKYGITLDQTTATDYLASDGTTTMWSAASNTGYGRRITGIGRDDVDSLYQKQSLSVDTGLVTIAAGNTIAVSNAANTSVITTDKSFFVFSDDGASPAYLTPVTGIAGVSTRMSRIFKVDKTNWTDQNITLKLNGGNAQTYLLVGLDAIFGAGDAAYVLSADSTVTLNSSLLPDGSYFTFATVVKGPNNVSNGVVLWLRADDGTANGSQWKDFTGRNLTATQGVTTAQPVTDAKAFNFNYGLIFDGGDYLTIPNSDIASIFPFGNSDRTLIGVSSKSVAALGTIFSYGNNTAGNGNGLYVSNTQQLNYFGWGSDLVSAANTYRLSTPSIVTGRYGGAGTNTFIDMNGANKASGAFTWNTTSTREARIGIDPASTQLWPGNIAEIVVYNRVLNATELQSVNSYLSLKYGITLNSGTQNYLATDGSTYWTTDATFKNRITGIGRDDSTALNTKQSLSVDTGLITVSLGNAIALTNETNSNVITNNKSFFVFADNGLAANNFIVPVTGSTHNVVRRMARVWKVQKTNWTDQNITLKIKPIGINNYMLISSDPTFATFSQELLLAANGTITLSSSLFTATDIYFTFGAPLITPGGVPGHVFWVRSDIGTSSSVDNTPIDEWNDFSAFGNNITQATSANQPLFLDDTTNNINFNPVIKFGGTSSMTAPSILKTGTYNGAAAFVVNSQVSPTSSSIFAEVSTGGHFNLHGTWSDNILYWDAPVTSNRLTYNTGGINNQVNLWTTTSDIALPSGKQAIYKNGVSVATGNNTSTYTGTNSTFQVGRSTATYNGRIAEIIIYTSPLTVTQQQGVNSYLALKYGITLNNGLTDYLATDGTTKVWDATANATYKNNIAGIGRDDEEALKQKQSRSINAGTQVTIGLGSIDSTNSANANDFTADKSYFIWGNDNGALTFRTAVTGTSLLNYRMTRIWKVQETGSVGNVVVAIPANALASPASSYIIISNDETFTGSDAITKLNLLTINNKPYYAATIDFASNSYFTFGTDLKIPGGVTGNALWLRADYGTSSTVDNTAIDEWDDFGADINHALQANAPNQPLYMNNAGANVNFNPVLSFNGTSSFLDIDITKLPMGTTARTVIALGKPLSLATTNRYMLSWGPSTTSQGTAVGSYTTTAGAFVGYGDDVASPAGFWQIGQPNILMGVWNGAGGAASIYSKGKLAAGPVNKNWNTTGTVARVGNSSFAATQPEYWNGYTGELIAYPYALNPGQRLKVESYLGIKYGYTIDQTTANNYLATDSSVIWDATINSAYKYSITGIGRDDLEGLNQKQSRNTDTTRLRIAIGLNNLAETNIDNTSVFAADKSYLIWGDDNNAITFKTVVGGNPSVNFRMTRIWKVQETGTIGTVEVAFPYDVLPNPNQSYLVVSNDVTFDGSDTYTPLYKITLNGKVHWAAQVDPTTGQYFTVAGFIKSPGGVGMTSLWVRADNGIVNNVDGSPVDTWVDFGNEVNNASQATAANQPIFQNNTTDNINYNPVVKFNGTSHFMNLDINKLPVSTTARTFVGVGSLNNIAGNRYIAGWGTAATNQGMGLANVGGTGYFIGYGNDLITAAGFYQLNTPNELFGTWAGAGGQANLYSKMASVVTPANKAWTTGTAGARIGSSPWAAEYWSGPIAEVIAFDRALNTNERQRVSTYLAIRHGYTINQTAATDYLNTNSTVIWDATANAAYKNNIAGIGRDDEEGLDQKQSKSVQPGAIVAIGLGTIDADNSSNTNSFNNDTAYVIWGSNSAALTTMSTDLPAGFCYAQRLTQEWKTSISNFNNTLYPVTMEFDLTGITIAGTTASDFILLIDTDGDGDFTTGTVKQITASSYTANKVTFNAVTDLVHNCVFTIVTAAAARTAVLSTYGNTTATIDECYNGGWILFKDPADATKYVAGIYDPAGLINISQINATVNVSNAFSSLGKGNPLGAMRLVRRMLEVNCTNCFDKAANPNPDFTVRLFYSPAELTAAENSETNNLESIKTANGISGSNTFKWFKAEGTVANVLANLQYNTISLPGHQWDNGELPVGTVDGVDYVDFVFVDSFSTFGAFWTVGNNIALPVNFISFKARKINDNVLLNWTVADEQNIKGYYVERNTDGIHWSTIGFVTAKSSAAVNDYTLTDLAPVQGRNYYRIRDEDVDGRSAYSVVRLVEFNEKAFIVNIYPVPARNKLKLNINNTVEDVVKITITDAIGRLVMTGNMNLQRGGSIHELDISKLSGGVYAIELTSDRVRFTGKFVKE